VHRLGQDRAVAEGNGDQQPERLGKVELTPFPPG